MTGNFKFFFAGRPPFYKFNRTIRLLDNDFIPFRAFQILVGKCDNSGSFGELALMYNMPRAATVQAATEADGGNGMLWAMDRCAQKLIQSKSRYSQISMFKKNHFIT